MLGTLCFLRHPVVRNPPHISQPGCHKAGPQTERHFFPPLLDAGSPRSSGQQGWFPQRTTRAGSFQGFPPQLADGYLLSASPRGLPSGSFWVLISSSHKDTSYMEYQTIRITPFYLNDLFEDPHPQIQPHSEVLEAQAFIIWSLREYNSSHKLF